MATPYTVSIHLEVTDEKALHAHAVAQATAGPGGLSLDQAHELMGTPDEPNVSECLRMVFDPGISPPGTSILDSSCD